jgi:hypothetical protein
MIKLIKINSKYLFIINLIILGKYKHFRNHLTINQNL